MADLWPNDPAEALAQQPQSAGAPAMQYQWPDSDTAEAAPPNMTPANSGPSMMSRIGTGMLDPALGTLQLASLAALPQPMVSIPSRDALDARLSQTYGPMGEGQLKAPEPAAIDQALKDRETDYQGERAAAGQAGPDYARMVGNVLSPMNFLPIPGVSGAGIGSAIANGAIRGAAASMEQPVTEGDYGPQKALQGASGMVMGGAMGPVASAIAGKVSPDVSLLRGYGTVLTPAQEGSRPAAILDATAARLPILKNMAAGQQTKSLENFNTGFFNKILEPIGEDVPKGTAGHEGFQAVKGKIDAFYDNLMPRLSYDPNYNNGQIVNDLLAIEQKLPQNFQGEFDRRAIQPLMQPLAGDALKKVDSELGFFANRYQRSMVASEKDLGDALDQANDLLRQHLIQTNPAAAADLAAADKAYAGLKIAQRAGAADKGAESVFTPKQALTAMGQGPYGMTPGQFAAGQGMLQPFAEAANRVIGSNRGVGNRPATALDVLMSDVIGDAIGTGIGAGALYGGQQAHESGLPWYVSGAGLAGLPFLAMTRPGQAALRAFGPQGAVRSSVGGLLGNAAPATIGGLLGRGELSDYGSLLQPIR